MPLKIKISWEGNLSDIWISKEDFMELNSDQIIELFEEDITEFLYETGGLPEIVTEVIWEE